MSLFDINNTFFTILNYSLSYLEFLGTLSGIIAVWFSARANVWSWPIGLVNVVLSFFLFYQVQLYPDMFLQIFFFITNLIGWWRWKNPRTGEEDLKAELKVSWMKPRQMAIITGMGVAGTLLLGLFASRLHEFFPVVFTKPSASPFIDSFITVMSIVATYYMIQKKIECWIIWIMIDVTATYLYFIRDIKFYSLLYLVLTFLAIMGMLHWMKEYKSYSKKPI
jgi:nicotinamide mononucleotide transporter